MPLKGFLIASNKSWVNTRLTPLNLPQSDKNSLVWLCLHWFQWNYHDLWPTKLSVTIHHLYSKAWLTWCSCKFASKIAFLVNNFSYHLLFLFRSGESSQWRSSEAPEVALSMLTQLSHRTKIPVLILESVMWLCNQTRVPGASLFGETLPLEQVELKRRMTLFLLYCEKQRDEKHLENATHIFDSLFFVYFVLVTCWRTNYSLEETSTCCSQESA